MPQTLQAEPWNAARPDTLPVISCVLLRAARLLASLPWLYPPLPARLLASL